MSIQIALQAAQHTWLLPQQVYDLLSNYSNYGFKFSTTRPSSPPSSGLFLYDKKVVSNWGDDGGQWTLLKNGFLPISSHVLIGYMWHESGAFLRRVYWLVSNEHVVLVHYLSRSAELGMQKVPAMMPMTPTPSTPLTPAPMKSETSFPPQLPSFLSMQMMQCFKGLEDSSLRPMSTPTPSPPPLSPLQQLGASASLDMLSPDDLKKLILANKESRTRGGAGLDLGAFLPQLPSYTSLPPATNSFSSLLSGSSMGMSSLQQTMPMGMDFFSPHFSPQSTQPQQPQQQQQPSPSVSGITSNLGRLGMNFLMSTTPTTPTAGSSPTTSIASPSTPSGNSPVSSVSTAPPTPLSPEEIVAEEELGSRVPRRGKQKDVMEANNGRPMDKMQKIRARKAEVARACRIRKKQYIKSLEEKSARLSARLAEVEARLEQSESRNSVYREEQKTLLEKLSKQSSTSIEIDIPPPTGLSFKLEGEGKLEDAKRLMEQLVSHLRRPHLLLSKHLTAVEENLEPVDHVKFLIWACTQSDDFYSKFSWQSLIHKELNLTESQIRTFMEMKSSIQSLKKDGFDLQAKLKQLSDEIKHHVSGRERGVQELLSMLSPMQAAKLAVWVDQNSKAMEITPTVAPMVAMTSPRLGSLGMLPTDDLLDTSEDDHMNLFPEMPRFGVRLKTPSVWSTSPLASSASPFSFSPADTERDFFTS